MICLTETKWIKKTWLKFNQNERSFLLVIFVTNPMMTFRESENDERQPTTATHPLPSGLHNTHSSTKNQHFMPKWNIRKPKSKRHLSSTFCYNQKKKHFLILKNGQAKKIIKNSNHWHSSFISTKLQNQRYSTTNKKSFLSFPPPTNRKIAKKNKKESKWIITFYILSLKMKMKISIWSVF